ncbi:hypothetical protein U1Q18_040655, partial [Sarracenia purpurea var. burkii]
FPARDDEKPVLFKGIATVAGVLKLQTVEAISEESTEIIDVRRRRKDLIQRRIRGFSGDFPGEKKIVSGEEEAAG